MAYFSGQPEAGLLFPFAWIPAAAEMDVGADTAGKQVPLLFQAPLGRRNLCFPSLPPPPHTEVPSCPPAITAGLGEPLSPAPCPHTTVRTWNPLPKAPMGHMAAFGNEGSVRNYAQKNIKMHIKYSNGLGLS